MKKYILLFTVFSFLLGCKNDLAVKEPKKLIEQDQMVDILFDLALLEASKYKNVTDDGQLKFEPADFILKKYKVDSIQFSENNKYYSADYKTYKKMIDEVSTRLDKESKRLEKLVKEKEKKNPTVIP